MRSQRCTQCGTKLDVSRMDKGSKMACSSCGSVLVVGEVQATKRSLSDSGSAFQRSTKSGDAAPSVTPSRGRRASPEDAPTRERRERAPERGADRAKSKMPLMIGGGAVVVVGIVVAVMMGGNGGGSGGGASKVDAAKAWWTATQPKIGSADEKELRAILSEAQNKGYDGNPAFWTAKADILYKALAKKAPDDAAANKHLGRKSLQSYAGFKDLWAGMEKHSGRMPDRYVRFYEKHLGKIEDGKTIFIAESEYDSIDGLLGEFKAWRKQAEADPSPALIKKGLGRIEAITKGFGALPVVEYPFIVFLGSKELKGSAEAKKARQEALAPRAADVRKRARSVMKAFTERIAKPLGLKPLPKDSVLYIYAFDDPTKKTEVEQASRGESLDTRSSLFFHYRLREPMAFGVIPTAAEDTALFTSDLGHMMVHLLQKKYSKDPRDKWEDAFKTWNGLWLTEGFAEYLGSGAEDDGKFTGVSLRRAKLLKAMDSTGTPLFEIRDMVRCPSYQRYESYFRDTWHADLREEEDLPASVDELMASEAPYFARNAFQTQCWYLVYFLNEYENGKYREKFNDLVRTMLAGRRKPEKYGTGKWSTSEDAFAAIMGLKSDEDWNKLQDQYDDFIPKATLHSE